MKYNKKLIIVLIQIFSCAYLHGANDRYLVGFGKSDITYIEDSLGLFGYGIYNQRIQEKDAYTSRIYSRTISIKELSGNEQIINNKQLKHRMNIVHKLIHTFITRRRYSGCI